MKKLTFLLLPFLFSCASYTLTIPEAKVNQNLQKSFPLEKEYSLTKVELLNPQVKLLGNDKAEVKFNYKVSVPFLGEKEGKVDAKAKVIYDPKTATVYLTDFLPLNLKGKEASIISQALKLIGKVPVYRFEGTKAKLIKGIKVEKGKLLVKLGI
ncbi:DUF1439 domain-containing protein [Thermovibrio sp.]